MRRSLQTLLLVALFAVSANSAFAQGYPRWHHYRGGYVPGPAYGWPGEPLGPAYWYTGGWSWPGNPRTCGPGLCQDDPRY
jgi:hypothetical protein